MQARNWIRLIYHGFLQSSVLVTSDQEYTQCPALREKNLNNHHETFGYCEITDNILSQRSEQLTGWFRQLSGKGITNRPQRKKNLNKNNPWKIMEGKITYKGTQLTVISLMAIIWSQIWASGTDWLVIDFLRMGQVHQFMWSHPFCPTSGTRKSNSHLPTTTVHFRKICTPYGLTNCSH